MKKFMYTAIAMVAFSGSSMASEKQGKQIVFEAEGKITVKKEADKSCLNVAVVAFNSMVENGSSYSDAMAVSSTTLIACNLAKGGILSY